MQQNDSMMRLDRFLSGESEMTRSEVKKKIKSGLVEVNGITAVRPEQKINPSSDEILIGGKQVKAAGMVYLMLNKPQGVLSVTEDRRARTVLDLIAQPYARKLFPAGRLDKDTEGLLLLTNDGMLVHRLISPSRHVWKIYFAVVDGEMTKAHEDMFLGGMEIGEKHPTLPAVMRRLSIDGDFLWRMERENGEDAAQRESETLPSGLSLRMRQICSESLTLGDYSRCGEGQSLCAVALREGKFHQVKRMFEAVGGKVIFLKRLAIGSLTLDRDLAPGAYRPLTARELRELYEEANTVRVEEP